jgi:hypothetical protein
MEYLIGILETQMSKDEVRGLHVVSKPACVGN